MKILNVFFVVALCLITVNNANAQTKAEELRSLAESSLTQKDYVKARSLFKQAYRAFMMQGDYTNAIECGLQTGSLYSRENNSKEGLDVLLEVEWLISANEKKLGNPLYDLRFALANERLQIYAKRKSSDRAQAELNKLEEIVNQTKNDSLNKIKLYSEAEYYYAFGLNSQGDVSIQKLINQYKENKEYDRASEVYRNLIEKAKAKNNTLLASLAYERYIQWTDSVKQLKVKDELEIQEKKYAESLNTISEKDDALSSRMYIIVGLCILSAILAGALIFLAVTLLRFVMRNRTLKKSVQTANEHNELKSQFIHNISEQMAPTLNAISASADKAMDKAPEPAGEVKTHIEALLKFCDNIQELSELENTLSEPYETEEVDMNILCERNLDSIRGCVKPEVSLSVNAPKIKIKTNQEHLDHILQHLLKNAALHTESGYIILDFKKRGANVYQFVVTNSGAGIPEEMQEDMFKPFTKVRDLAEGDGLGLPICSLIAIKLNGNLTLDKTYTKGCRFILELRP
ncbi:MAG: ATP-binding protein [Dysgonomonas sp.]